MTGMKKKQKCPWCPENEYRCQSDEVVATCDYRTLGRSKEAVIDRIRKEREFIEEAVKSKEMDQEIALATLDRLMGVSVMIKYLKDNFKMTDEEIKKEAKFKKLGWTQKMKLMMKMKAMEKSRGK